MSDTIELGTIRVPRYDPDLCAKALEALLILQEVYDATAEELLHEWDKKVGFELSLIAEAAVSDFYLDYSPKRYNRQEDLFNAYEIIAKNGDWRIELGYEFMEGAHRVSNDYIYNLSFVGGWHGGAQKGDLGKKLDPPRLIPHPSPSDSENPDEWSPRWVGRTKLAHIPYWFKHPVKRMSGLHPEERIAQEADEYIYNAMLQMGKEYLSIIEKYENAAIDALKAALKSRRF